MKRFSLMALVFVILIIFSTNNVFSQNPREISFSGTHYYGHTPKIYKIDQDQLIIQFETLGVRANDEGSGPFHEAAVHIIGILYKGKDGGKLRAFETWTDANGDKVIWELTEKNSKDAQPGTSPGTARIVSGTGKYAGIQGTMDYILRNPKSFPEGTGRGLCKENVRLLMSE